MYVNPFWFGFGIGAITIIAIEVIAMTIIIKKGN